MKDVISQAGYNRSTFYQYFSDIYALRDYVENDVMETIRAKAGQKDNDIAQRMETQLSGIRDEIKPYVMEYHMATTLSLFRLWVARGKDISQEELFRMIHILYHNGYSGVKEKMWC